MNLTQFGQDAVARYNSRKSTDLNAGFVWNTTTKRYDIEVCGYVVASVKIIHEVKRFSVMHNTDRVS